MTDPANPDLVPARLRCGIVVRVREDACEIVRDRQLCSVRYATPFPSPRTERVSPGHLVAIATAPDGTEAVVWRWYDAGLPGADWWVAGGAAASAEDADVELDEVEQLYTEHNLWNTLV